MNDDPASLDRAALSAALARVADGDRAALADVYARTSAKLFGVCLRIFPDRADAEDALQDAYVNVWTRAGSFDPARASPITWLVTLTRNRAIDRLRARGRRQVVGVEEAFDLADETPGAEECLIAESERLRVHACMDTLARTDAALIRTAFFEGATYADLAERTASPLGTIKSRIRRALVKLRACLS